MIGDKIKAVMELVNDNKFKDTMTPIITAMGKTNVNILFCNNLEIL